jgi:hypothetical protein
LHPLNVCSDEDAQWLLACVWPDHPARRRRLEAAISLARENPPPVLAGELATDLPALLVQTPQDAQLVVFHSATLFYVTDEQKKRFVQVLTEMSRNRDVVWISNEGRGAMPELASIAPVGMEHAILLGRTVLSRGNRQDSVLALAHPHGAELTWLQ